MNNDSDETTTCTFTGVVCLILLLCFLLFRHNQVEIAKMLIEEFNCSTTVTDKASWTPLHWACWSVYEVLCYIETSHHKAPPLLLLSGCDVHLIYICM